MNRQNNTRQKVMSVSCHLFYRKGFHGTSVRDIASEAKVNVSLIHYYFKSKQGLFESLAVDFFEPYLEMLDQEQITKGKEHLKLLVKKILHYKQTHYQLSCLLYRELSLNTVFAKEMLVTYLAKENHLLTKLLFQKVSQVEVTFKEKLCLLQFKGLINAPFMMPQEFTEQIINKESIDHFVEVYSTIMVNQNSVRLLEANG